MRARAPWAAIAYTTLPGISLSAGIISTDVPLLFIWTLGLISLERTVQAHAAGDDQATLLAGAATGAAIGVGLLAKYSMSYFVLSGLIYIALSREARAAFLSPAGVACVALATLSFLPNLAWNAAQGFATVEHTAANANWQGDLFNLDKLVDFVVGQFGVFGPLLMVLFVFGLLTLRRRLTPELRRQDIFLLCFALPILAVIMGQAFVSRANANWAAPAYVTAAIVTVSWMLRANGARLIGIAVAMHLVSAATLYAAAVVPGAIEILGLENTFKRMRGWEVMTDKVLAEAEKAPYVALMADDRFVVSELTYYARASGIPVVMWDADGIPQNHFEAEVPYGAQTGSPVLYVSAWELNFGVGDRFETVVPLGEIIVPRGGKYKSRYYLYRLEGFRAGP